MKRQKRIELNPEAPTFIPAQLTKRNQITVNKHNKAHLKLWTMNVRSLNRPECIDTLRDTMNGTVPPPTTDQGLPDIICLTETWLKPTVSDAEVQIPGFNIIRKDREKRGGSVCVYIRNHISAKEINISQVSSNEHIEILSLKIQVNMNKSIVVTTIYRSPSAPISAMDDIHDLLEYHVSSKLDFFIVGDMNIDFNTPAKTKNKPYKLCARWLKKFKLEQIVTQSTRVTQKSSTTIDWIITNRRDRTHNTSSNPTTISDHNLIDTQIDVNIPKPKSSRIIKTRKWKSYSKESYLQQLRQKDWRIITASDDIEVGASFFNSLVLEAVNTTAPPLNRREKTHKKEHFPSDIMKEIKLRDDLCKLAHGSMGEKEKWDRYRTQKNYVNSLIRKFKTSKSSNEIISNWKDPKKLWSVLNRIIPRKTCDEPLTDILDLNSYLTKVGENIAKELGYEQGQHTSSDGPHRFELKPIGILDTVKIVKSLKNSKALAVDEIPVKFIKEGIEVLALPITQMVNLAIVTKKVPDIWKSAVIHPIFKKGDRSNPANYRPISILPIIAKILEKVINYQLREYLEHNQLISKSQYGFRMGSSCELALATMTEKLTTYMDSDKIAMVIQLDLSKAFDSVNHQLLSQKIEDLGINPEWFISYLNNRTQKVFINGKSSTTLPIKYGVPQGSALSPTLYNIFTSDIEDSMPKNDPDIKTEVIAYADDTNIILSTDPENIDTLMKAATSTLKTLETRFNQKGLKLNPDKTKYIIITKKKIRKTIEDKLLTLKIDSTTLKEENALKTLGIYIDKYLKFDVQAEKTAKKMTSRTMQISRRRHLLTQMATETLVKSLVLPCRAFCTSIWGRLRKKDANQIEKSLNHATRIIFKLKKRDGTSQYRRRLKWDTHQVTNDKALLIFMYKLINKEWNQNCEPPFQPRLTEEEDKRTRAQKSKGVIQRKVISARTIEWRASRLWNQLKPMTRNAKKIKTFKSRIQEEFEL